jgi:uncharacterized protein YecA (UPF0149 family)
MDTRDRTIYNCGALRVEDKEYMKEMDYYPTPTQRANGRVGRNDICPCGSGKKFKKCCLFKGRK